MDESKINDIINSQKDFLDSNSNSINSRILLLKKLLINIKLFEEEIYEALSKDLNKAKFESFLTEILLVEKEIKLFIKKINHSKLFLIKILKNFFIKKIILLFFLGIWNVT